MSSERHNLSLKFCILLHQCIFSLQTNEVNQGDALEHNFNAVYNALLLPVSHIFPVQEFPQVTVNTNADQKQGGLY